MTTTIYRNDTTGYTVTLIDNGRGAIVKDSKGYAFPMVGSDYPYAGILAASRAKLNGATEVPAPDAYVPSGPPVVTPTGRSKLAARFGEQAAEAAIAKVTRPLTNPGASLVIPSLPQARCLLWSAGDDAAAAVRPVARGFASVDGRTAPLPVLVAMARRGWLELNHPIRPTFGRITRAGHLALLAYVTKNGPVQ